MRARGRALTTLRYRYPEEFEAEYEKELAAEGIEAIRDYRSQARKIRGRDEPAPPASLDPELVDWI